MAKRWIEGLVYLLGGFLGGVILIAVLALCYLYFLNWQVESVKQRAVVVITPRTEPWPSVTPYPSRTPGPLRPVQLSTATREPISAEFAPIVFEAQNFLTGGQPAKVAPLMNEWLDQIDSLADKATAYTLLAEAELAQDHYRIAAQHYDQLFFYEPTAQNLMTLAQMCEVAGYLEAALERYRMLLTYSVEQTGEAYRLEAEARIDLIEAMCTGCD